MKRGKETTVAFMNSKRIGLSFVISLCLAASLYPAEPKRGGNLRFGVSKNFTTLNPFVRMQSVDHRVRSLVYEGLLAVDKNLDSMPALAASWSVSADGLLYTFTLRPGVKFHDGKSLSPSDIKWTIEYAQDPKNGAWGRADLTIVEKIDVAEPDRVRIRLKSPYTPFLSAISGIHWFPVVPQDSLQTGDAQRDSLPPGTGPFRFLAWKPGQELRLGRFEGYWQKGLPYLDEARFIVTTDDTVRGNAVRAGDLDIAEEIPEEMVLRIREGKIPSIGVVMAAAGNHPRMGINHCRPPFNDVKVRQAFVHALDKQEILNGAYSGLGTPTNQKLVRGTKWFVSEVPERKQDLAKARALLAEAGYPEGVKLTVVGWTGTEKVLQVVQSQVKRAGIEMTLLIRDFPTHIAALNKAEFQISMSGGSTNSDPDLAYYGYYHTPPAERRHLGGRTQPCYSNGRVDQLLDEARKIADTQQRRRMYREMIGILQEEVADIPLAFVPNGYALQNSVRDFEPTILSTFSYGNGGVLKTWMDK
jgi:peptide/nickel transport system substrate-binding protein